MTRIAVVVIVLAIVVGVGGYYGYQYSLQPNIQATNIQFASPEISSQNSTAQDAGRVANSGSFSYTAPANGSVYLVFDNSFSGFSSKAIAITYTVWGATTSNAFTVSPGEQHSIEIPMTAGQSISGTFTVSGGARNDIGFSIIQYTCSETMPFSLILVNSGSANGYGTLVLRTGDGVQVWSNRFYVQQSQQLPVSGTATTQNCAAHTLTPTVSSVKG
jgi:hypothetical protein